MGIGLEGNELPEHLAADADFLRRLAERTPAFHGLPELGLIQPTRSFDLGRTLEVLRPDVDFGVPEMLVAPEIAGFGLFRFADGATATAIVSYREELRGSLQHLADVAAIVPNVAAVRDQLRSNPLVFGLPPPVLRAGCGSELWASEPGSAGPIVRRRAKAGILTVGHVATTIGVIAYLDRRPWGTVEFSTSGTSDPADVAFIARSEGVTARPRCPQPTVTVRPALGAIVAGFGAESCRQANVMGIMPFQWFPALGRNLAEMLVTAGPMAEPGDSGGLVIEEETGAMVGLVVGTDQKSQTYCAVQLAEYSLPAAGCVL